jgi:hypothetical protein
VLHKRLKIRALARQATQPGEIDSLESIPGLLKIQSLLYTISEEENWFGLVWTGRRARSSPTCSTRTRTWCPGSSNPGPEDCFYPYQFINAAVQFTYQLQ